MISDEDLVNLNKSVYFVDPNYSGENTNGNLNLMEGSILEFRTGFYKVLSTRQGDWGFKGMAVAPIVNGVPDTSQVVIVAAGTDPSKPKELISAGSEWVGQGSKQTSPAEAYVSEIINNNPDWNVSQLTGYSQSAYMLKIGARRQIPTTVFNGWIRYDSFTDLDEKRVRENPDLFINYRQKLDMVSQMTNTKKDLRFEGEVEDYVDELNGVEGFGSLIWLEGSSHDLSSWKFDAQGRILIPDTPDNDDKIVKQRKQAIAISHRKKTNYLKNIERKFQAKGSITPNEQIYLDDSNALAFVEKVATEYKMNCQDVIRSLRQSIDEIEQPWIDIQTEAFRVGTLLTQSEVYEAMESVGVTKQSVVLEPLEEYTDMLNEWLEKERDFDALIEKIKTSIAKLVELDEDLARQINS